MRYTLENKIWKQWVVGSIPARGTIHFESETISRFLIFLQLYKTFLRIHHPGI